MPAASVTLTGTIADIIGVPLDPTRVTVRLQANVDMILDKVAGIMHMGRKEVAPDTQGVWKFPSVLLTDTTDTNPSSPRWRIEIQAWPTADAPTVTYASKWFPLTAATPAAGGVVNIKDVDFVDVPPDPGWQSQFQNQMQTLLDQANAAATAAQNAADAAAVDAAQSVKDEILSQVLPQTDFVPSQTRPVGLTLIATHTASASNLDYTAHGDWVYVVVAGAGGGACTFATTYPSGGGAGACFQGWMRTSALKSITIGAGGVGSTSSALAGNGGATIAGPLRVPGGTGGGNTGATLFGAFSEPGAGRGGAPSTGTSSYGATDFSYEHTAFGIFTGGRGGNGAVAGYNAGFTGTSGGGGCGMGVGGDGIQGPGGGGSSVAGGGSVSPNGTTYTTTFSGGCGILGASTGINGGPGGGGGGGTLGSTASGAPAGNGGNGAVLIYATA